jgi:serine/threonine protein kinase
MIEDPRFDDQPTRIERPDEPAGSSAAPREPRMPESIGDYQILGVFGRGGMGVVYEAEQQSPRRIVALKVIRGDGTVDAAHVAMFRRETTPPPKPSCGTRCASGRKPSATGIPTRRRR